MNGQEGTTGRPVRQVALVLLAMAATMLFPLLATATAATALTVTASADSYVRSDTPDANYGTKYVLAAEAASASTPLITSYVRFDVSGLSAAPAKVTLRLYSYAQSATGLQISTAANTWSETGITFSNAPGAGGQVATMPNLTTNAWSEADVSSVVSGNGSYTFVLTTTSTANKQLASRESTATPPQLVIDPGTTTTTSASPSPTVSATASASPSTTTSAGPSTSASPSPSANPTSTPAAVTTTVAPNADASVRSDQPDTNAGSAYTLYAQAASSTGPEQRSYLRFDVQGLSGTVISAALQLYSYSTSSEGVQVATAGNSWTESAITWNNAPPPGAGVGSAAPLTLNTWASADVTPAVTGNGVYTFVVTTTRTTADKFASREASTSRPRLVVTTTGSGTSASTSPTPSPTVSASSSPSSSPSGSPSGTGGDPTIVASGDIACTQGTTPTSTSCQQQATSDLAVSLAPTALLPLGDDQYDLGSLDDFRTMYDPTWGRLNAIAHPVPGNHEYGYIGTSIQPTGGAGYFQYFGDRSHPLDPGCTSSCTSWYSYDVGAWHLVALDSQCGVIGGCNPGNPEYQWLANDLKAHPAACTLAYWHIPLFSSSQDHQPDMQSIFQLLYDNGADVVLNGHAHFYERFAPQDAFGNADPTRGVREILVGTGGRSFFAVRDTPAANSEVRIANTFGVLQMTLHPTSYDWRFVPVPGSTATDSGSGTCH